MMIMTSWKLHFLVETLQVDNTCVPLLTDLGRCVPLVIVAGVVCSQRGSGCMLFSLAFLYAIYRELSQQ